MWHVGGFAFVGGFVEQRNNLFCHAYFDVLVGERYLAATEVGLLVEFGGSGSGFVGAILDLYVPHFWRPAVPHHYHRGK